MSQKRIAVAAAMAAGALLVPGTLLAPAQASPSAVPGVTGTDNIGEGADGPVALRDEAAAAYQLPADVHQTWTASYPDGTVQTHYQQTVAGADVLGGQVTVLKDATGAQTAVIGAHFSALQPTNSVKLTKAAAIAAAARALSLPGARAAGLKLDPRNGRLFYEVETKGANARRVQWVDASSGTVLKSYDALMEGQGVGVKDDTKSIDTTQQAGGLWQLVTADGRQKTYDAQNGTTRPGVIMTDPDNVWDLKVPLNPSPSQPPGVDAHYYANLIDDFYGDTFRRNSIDNAGMPIISTVHYDKGYCNAFWDGAQMTYGDGDGVACKSLSGGLDVVGHELTHGVTEFTSGLIYEGESGALNESFSDMMGNTAEFYADSKGLDPSVKPDWLIGEDVIPAGVYGGANPGFRNMGDPQDDGDPDHYSEKYTGTSDNGGVHTNSGIPNHAYYLAVNGGKNAGCIPNNTSGHAHTADCGVSVPALGLAAAEQVFYKGFTSLTEYANFCDARNATVTSAGAKTKGGPNKQARQATAAAVGLAWDAVGVHAGCAPGTPPPPPCTSNPNAQIPFESPHPYGNNGDCTWTFDNGSAGFAFHFDQLETEAGYDYVYVYDANGNELAKYDGTHPLGQTSPCIPTSVGSVRLVSDAGVTDQGFHVDAVSAC